MSCRAWQWRAFGALALLALLFQGPAGAMAAAWEFAHVRALDDYSDAPDQGSDAVALYARLVSNRLHVRIDLMDLGQATDLQLYIALDFDAGGGRNDLGGLLAASADVAWDRLVVIDNQAVAAVYDTGFQAQQVAVADFVYDTELDYVQFSLPTSALPGWSSGGMLKVQVLSTEGGDTEVDRMPEDGAVASNLLAETVGRAKLVVRFGNTFIGANPASIDWYDGYGLVPPSGEVFPGQRRGYRYLLDAFENYGLPLVLGDLRMDVISGLDQLNVNARLRQLVADGAVELEGTLGYGHFMPWHPSDANAKALALMRKIREGYELPISPVFYPYEAKLRLRDLATIRDAGFDVVNGYDLYLYILGDAIDDWSCGGIDWQLCTQQIQQRLDGAKKLHKIDGTTFVFDGRFYYGGTVTGPRWDGWVWPSEAEIFTGTDGGLHLGWRRILLDMARNPDQEMFFTIGTDFSLTSWLYEDIADANAA